MFGSFFYYFTVKVVCDVVFPFRRYRGRAGMNPGMAAGVGGWSSPGRMTSPKVSVTKKKNETKLIKEFKSNRYPDLELRDLCGHVIEFAQDQQGEETLSNPPKGERRVRVTQYLCLIEVTLENRRPGNYWIGSTEECLFLQDLASFNTNLNRLPLRRSR